MSNVLSIAAVTAVIKDLLENGLVSDTIVSSIGDVLVTALPPDRISVEADERPQLNLFLYQISPNRNADWLSQVPARQSVPSRADRATNLPLVLDLYYVLTAYGAKDFQAELLLGYAIQLLHNLPALTSERIETALNNAAKVSTANIFSQTLSSISAAELAKNIGQIKISSEFLNLEETSRLWSVLQTHYRPSTAYRVSMVTIPDRHEPASVEAKEDRAWLRPQIDRVSSLGERSISPTNPLLISGKNLQGEITKVRLGNRDISIAAQDLNPHQIVIKIPPHLYAGVQGLQILHSEIATPERSIESNLIAFVLHPEITATIVAVKDRDRELCDVEIKIEFNPKVHPSQAVVLCLYAIDRLQTIAYAGVASSATTDRSAIVFNLNEVVPGSYVARVRVDGAESQLPKEVSAATAATDRAIDSNQTLAIGRSKK